VIVTPGVAPGFDRFCDEKLIRQLREIGGPSLMSVIAPDRDYSITVAGGAVSSAVDQTGQGNDATQATPANRPTHNQATDSIDFVAASSQYLQWMVPNAAAGTIWAWAKCTNAITSPRIMGVRQALPNRHCTMLYHGGGNFYVQIGSLSVDTGIAHSLNVWHFFALTWEIPGNYAAYYDGSSTSGAIAGTLSTIALYVGAMNDIGAAVQFLPGSIGQHGILNRACTAAEIAAIRAITYRAP